MVIAKKILIEKINEEDAGLLREMEEHIDGELARRYVPGGSVSVSLKCNQRVVQKIKEAYSEKGWTVEIEHDQPTDQDFLVFK